MILENIDNPVIVLELKNGVISRATGNTQIDYVIIDYDNNETYYLGVDEIDKELVEEIVSDPVFYLETTSDFEQ